MTGEGLAGKVALITGVSRRRGIGAAVARTLAEAGCHLYITYYRPYDVETGLADDAGDLAEILATLREAAGHAAGVEADLADPTVPAQLLADAQDTVGPVDILINNATRSIEADVAGLTPDILDAHYAVNVRATVQLCTEFARRHDGRPGGRIINMTSGQAITPMPEHLAYATTKGAVEAFTISLAVALAPKRITVNAVDPGPTDTGWMSDALRTDLAARSPMGRVGLPSDAANLIRFLASDRAQWITGQILRSRGGF